MIHASPRTRLFFTAAATLGLCLLAVPILSAAAPQNAAPDRPIRLHNGWQITPAGTRHEELGDLLLGGVLSPDGRWLAFVNAGGAAHNVHIADATTGAVVASVPVERAQSSGGMVFARDGKTLYVSGGNAGRIYVLGVNANGTLTIKKPLVLEGMRNVLQPKPADPGTDAGRDPMRQDNPAQDAYLGGLALSPNGETLYVTNLAGNSVFALNTRDGVVTGERVLLPNDRPGAIAVSPDGKTLYVALWGKGAVVHLDAETMQRRTTLAVGAHPNTVLLNKNGSRLFVACGNDDSVYTFDTASGRMGEKVSMRLTPRSPAGATPSALALSPDEKTLYVANSDNNAIAVVNVAVPDRSRVEGFIPTTFYPTMVAASRDGKRLFVGSAKGYAAGPNGQAPDGKIDPVAPKGYPYIVQLLKGVLSTVPVPTAAQLTGYTKQVYANSPYKDALLDTPAAAPQPGSNAIPSGAGAPSPIKHVLYIIKENRTYDQVFGDMKDAGGKAIGNGDPNLCLFGEDVTPNHHALAREFVLLDNLYADGEVSVDGHHWSNGAYVPDSMQRTWPAQYGSKGAAPIRHGDFGDPLAETPGGRIWDLCARANLSYRTYYYHVDKNRSDEWSKARKAGVRDYDLADIYIKDLAAWEKSGEMPRFAVMALSEDHTKGTRPGTFTPKACVASNDVGLGKIVEACSKSRFWKEMAIFVIEDDAQNGPDHVDAHRTVALAISPYTRRGSVDSTFYSTCSLLRTMELILGLPPMSQFDAAATPLYASFTATPDARPFTLLPARVDLQAKNGQRAYGAKASMAMNLSEPDQLSMRDEDTLNRLLWHSVKGADTPYPGIVRRPLFNQRGRSIATVPGKKD
ncbi:MAG: beta-propeller fold lactonase family protein [Akkermansiaceae bacterium]|nr:beta-propeller fold lactonase family protein [Armatimonadota bacterium]